MIYKINLMPWRQEKQQENRKQFFSGLITIVVIMIVIAIAAHIYLSNAISLQKNRNQYLQSQVGRYQKQIGEIANLKKLRISLIERMNVIQRLQANRPFSVKLFDDIAKVIPDGVYVISITHTGKNITVIGRATANSHIAEFMRNIQASKLLHNPKLSRIGSQAGNFKRDFAMTMQQLPTAKAKGKA